VKVDRIIPVEYSAVTVRTASAPSSTAPTKKNPPNEQAVGSNVARCATVMEAHWLAWEMQRTAPNPTEIVTAMTAVRQVEGSVRSLVHSDLRTLLVGAVRTCRAGGVM
jgi:hypothetical protein